MQGEFHNWQLAAGTANSVAEWNGNAWLPVGSGMNDDVYAFAFDSAGNLYAGGAFTTAGGGAANGIAEWNGAVWTGLGSGISGGPVKSLL